jgi:hypothetical protein
MTALITRRGWRLSIAALAAAFVSAFGVANTANASDHAAPVHGEEAPAETVDYSGLKIRGIDLGEFRVRTYYPVDAQKSTVRFMLHVAVSSEHYTEMEHLVKEHEHKLRDQVITATRMAPLAIFDEPDLKSFRRRLFMRLRRALPELAVDAVYISEFQLTVKSL